MIRLRTRPHPGPASNLATATLLAGVVLAGCARGGEVETPAPPQPQPPLPADFEESIPPPEEPEVSFSAQLRILEEAEESLAEGRFQRASLLFSRFLAREYEAENDRNAGKPPPGVDRALWGVAILHLLPEADLYDQERAVEALDRLADEYGDTVRGMQAAWIRGILRELDQVRAQANQQEELLRQLTETVEQLKRIDLNRRPTGSGDTTVTRDTVPSRR
jgi:hypothetical protein